MFEAGTTVVHRTLPVEMASLSGTPLSVLELVGFRLWGQVGARSHSPMTGLELQELRPLSLSLPVERRGPIMSPKFMNSRQPVSPGLALPAPLLGAGSRSVLVPNSALRQASELCVPPGWGAVGVGVEDHAGHFPARSGTSVCSVSLVALLPISFGFSLVQ